MTRWHLIWLALLVPLPSGCSPPGMYQRAAVRIENGQACFSVNGTKETRKTTPSITGTHVQVREPGDWRTIWEWHTPYQTGVSIPLPPDRCIPFGYRGPPGSSDVHEPLRPGASYSISIMGDVPNPNPGGDPTIQRVFLQEFCVREGPQGREIVLVPRGSDGGSQWQVCDTLDTPAIPGILNDANS
jgi:hypothetical protein